MTIQESIKSQYHASLEMLRQAVVTCPDALWDDPAYANTFSHVAYHILFYVHLYLQPSEKDFTPWARPGKVAGGLEKEAAGESYSREDILTYLQVVSEQVDQRVTGLELDAPSGFFWLPFDKLELQLYNLRHIQHHTGELCERLGSAGGVEVAWVGTRPGDAVR